MRLLKVAFVALLSFTFLCSLSFLREYPKVKVADGYVQIDKVSETSIYLEVFVYNASTEYVSGIVTVMRAGNLSDNQKVIKIGSGKIESVLFPKEEKNKIVTWEEIKLHSFFKTR